MVCFCEKTPIAPKKEKRNCSENSIDEKTPRSKFRIARRKFEGSTPKISSFFIDKQAKILVNPNTSPGESQKVARVISLTPSSDTLERKTAANRDMNQFGVFSKPVNMSRNESYGNGIEKYGKRKMKIFDLESEGHFSPKKMPKIDRSINE